jgi:hypothetical protein
MIGLGRASLLMLSTWLLLAAAPDVTVVNHAPVGIAELYVSSADEDSWGENRLSQALLAPGQVFHVSPLRARGCQVDMRVIYANGALEDRRGLDICRTRQFSFTASDAISPTMTAPSHAAHTIIVTNHAPRPVVELYVSPASADDWGNDLLANQPVSTGGVREVKPDVSCRADLRVVFNNRSAEERRDIDICTHSKLDIKPGWTTSDDLAALSFWPGYL